jgi:Uma2 family endonuclease
VRSENERTIQDDAIYGSPDLVIEIVSPNDSARYQMHLETDYRSIGVNEILFIDPKKRRVKYVSMNENGYDCVYLTDGRLRLSSIQGFDIEIDWIFTLDRPDPYTLLKQLIN